MYSEEVKMALESILELVFNALNMLQGHWWIQNNRDEGQ